MHKKSHSKTNFIKQNRLILVSVVSVGFVLNIIGDVTSPGLDFEGYELILGCGFTLLYLLFGLIEEWIIGYPPLKNRIGLYLTVQIFLLFGIGWMQGNTGTWLIALPLVGWAVETLSFIWNWPVFIAIGLALVLPIGLREGDWVNAVYAIPAFSAAILFVVIFTRMRLNEQNNRQKAESLSKELEEKNRQLETYAAQVKELATTEERSRLARELHDSVTQSLYSLSLLAAGWRRLASDGRLENIEDSFAEIEEVAQQALKEMRLLIYELRPPALDTEGFLGALHQRLNAVEKRAGVEVRLVASGVVDLSPEVEEALYAIANEALNNALKHAGAKSITVNINVDLNHTVLEVADDGKGFDPDAKESNWGMGLENIQQRTAQIGGSMEISASPEKGTHLRIEVPR